MRESKTYDYVLGKLRMVKTKPLTVTVRDMGDLSMALTLKKAAIKNMQDDTTKMVMEGEEMMILDKSSQIGQINIIN